MKKIKLIALLTILLITLFTFESISAVTLKRLYFWEKDNKMYYEPTRDPDGYWFMSFRNMVPGGEYNDTMLIQNGSKSKEYDLYMQVIPRDQTILKDELLELISMKVFYDEKLIYDGKATGKKYQLSSINLQNVVFLGTYSPNDEARIDVEIGLSQDIGFLYSNQLTKIDWKFMVTEEDYIDDLLPDTSDSNTTTSFSIFAILIGIAIIIITSKAKE